MTRDGLKVPSLVFRQRRQRERQPVG